MLYPLMEAIRSGGDLRNVGGSSKYEKDIVCPDGCVTFRLTARRIGGENPFISKAFIQSGVAARRIGGENPFISKAFIQSGVEK